jgi:hypothetical protein
VERDQRREQQGGEKGEGGFHDLVFLNDGEFNFTGAYFP